MSCYYRRCKNAMFTPCHPVILLGAYITNVFFTFLILPSGYSTCIAFCGKNRWTRFHNIFMRHLYKFVFVHFILHIKLTSENFRVIELTNLRIWITLRFRFLSSLTQGWHIFISFLYLLIMIYSAHNWTWQILLSLITFKPEES